LKTKSSIESDSTYDIYQNILKLFFLKTLSQNLIEGEYFSLRLVLKAAIPKVMLVLPLYSELLPYENSKREAQNQDFMYR